jgi:hypothetical protein
MDISDTMTSNSFNVSVHKKALLLFYPPFTHHNHPPHSHPLHPNHPSYILDHTYQYILNTIIMSTEQIPTGAAGDNDYQSRTGQSEIPVLRDEAPIESTEYDNGGDSDKQLGRFIHT